MSAMSDYLENEILDHVLNVGSYTAPSALYVGLSTASFNDDNSGTELSGGSYSRQAVTFSAASSGTTSNNAAVEFSPATSAWGVITHYGIFDASTGGNLLIHGAFTSSRTIAVGDIVKIIVGDLDITAA